MRGTVLLAWLIAAPVWAQTPNRLTPEEARAGWILLFDGESTFGWTATNGTLKVDNGSVQLGEAGRATLNTALPTYFELKAEFRHGLKMQLDRDGRNIAFTLGNPDDQEQWSTVHCISDETTKGGFRYTIAEPGATKPRVSGSAYTREEVEARTATILKLESAGRSEVRSVRVRPLGSRSLFNGKDLTGWKIFDGKKSKFAVIDGAINIQDGPGDLQTEGTYQDFILQFECISNGKHLNSGVFFRCRPNEYQNGYEAQVRNQFTPEATQDYAIEVYDPKTNQLVEKKKVKSTAFDFGTGAIYRRVPARKEVAKDGEWFTMTIAAQGNHLATWVNGIQQVDWYDHRPPSDNARTGYRREGGHISLQGHDPTTNLSFRNFRIAELPNRE